MPRLPTGRGTCPRPRIITARWQRGPRATRTRSWSAIRTSGHHDGTEPTGRRGVHVQRRDPLAFADPRSAAWTGRSSAGCDSTRACRVPRTGRGSGLRGAVRRPRPAPPGRHRRVARPAGGGAGRGPRPELRRSGPRTRWTIRSCRRRRRGRRAGRPRALPRLAGGSQSWGLSSTRRTIRSSPVPATREKYMPSWWPSL